ncbi:hypothetical protein LEMLEM_LOCUS16878 [Lemmus lemmus]
MRGFTATKDHLHVICVTKPSNTSLTSRTMKGDTEGRSLSCVAPAPRRLPRPQI